MTGRTRLLRARLGVAAAAVCAITAACASGGQPAPAAHSSPAAQGSPAAAAGPTAPSVRPTVAPPAPVADYRAAVRAAVAHHLRVWIETDLVKRWEAGRGPFAAGVRRAAGLARLPGVAGIKIADELGYNDGMDNPAMIRQFLSDAARALRAAVPRARLLVDMVIPELGCLPGHQVPGNGPATCARRARAEYPQLALAQVDGYLSLHDIDVLDLSTSLLTDSTYAQWGSTASGAQQAAWREVSRRGWGRLVYLQARKALAHPGSYSGGPAQARADLRTFVDLPLASGAHAVDVWTWRQLYEGSTYQLMNPGSQPNALWDGLVQRRSRHDVLFTHMSPHSLEQGLNPDLAMISTVFSDIFLPAGTG